MACLVAVYGAEFGRGVWAEIEPLLMIRPPRGVWAFISAERLLRAEEGAGQVDVDDLPPLLDVSSSSGTAGRRCRRC